MNPIHAWLRQPYDLLRALIDDRKFPPAHPILPVEVIPPPKGQITDIQAAAEHVRVEVLCSRNVELTRKEIGHGELPGKNNRGPDIVRYCAPIGDGHEWCAGLVGYVIARSAEAMGIGMPVRRSLTAKKMAGFIAAYGRSFTDIDELRPGDYAVYDRGARGSHKGHIEIVESIILDKPGMFVVITGNSEPLVCRKTRDLANPKLRFREFVSFRKKALLPP